VNDDREKHRVVDSIKPLEPILLPIVGFILLLLIIGLAVLAFADWSLFIVIMPAFFIGAIVLGFIFALFGLGAFAVKYIHVPLRASRVLGHAEQWAVVDEQAGPPRFYQVTQERTTYNLKGELGEQTPLALPSPSYEQPSLEVVIRNLPANTLEFVYGLNPESGELVRSTLPKAVHIQLLGASGQGKSRQATSIVTQLTTRNDPAHLQLALVDCEGDTSAPFTRLAHVRMFADEPKEAAKTFRALVAELERRDQTRQVWPVILIFVEEFLNLRRTMPAEYRDQALEDYTTLALRGRKRGLFLFSIGQTAYTEKSIRDAQMQFLSSMAFAIKPTAARASGFTNTQLLNRLYEERKPGQFLLERPAGDSILLAPFVDNQAVDSLLSGFNPLSPGFHDAFTSTTIESTVQPRSETSETPLDARSFRIRELLKAGTPQPQIVREVWGVSSGAGYTKAQKELAEIIRTLL